MQTAVPPFCGVRKSHFFIYYPSYLHTHSLPSISGNAFGIIFILGMSHPPRFSDELHS